MLRGDAELAKYVYPFELDADTRLRRDDVQARGIDDATRRRAYDLLIAAGRDFDDAKAKDPAYAPAYVNLAGVYDLLGEEDLAAAFAEKAGRVAAESHDDLSAEDANIIIAIVRARQNQTKEAEAILQVCQTDLARMNLDILRGGSAPAANAPVDAPDRRLNPRPNPSQGPRPMMRIRWTIRPMTRSISRTWTTIRRM